MKRTSQRRANKKKKQSSLQKKPPTVAPTESSLKLEIAKELEIVRHELASVDMELTLIKKAFQQDFCSPNEPLQKDLTVEETNEVKMFEKMIEHPYVRVSIENKSGLLTIVSKDPAYKHSPPIIQEEICLSPPGLFFYHDVLIPCYNLNAINPQHIEDIKTLEFDVFPYLEAEDFEYPRLLIMQMFIDLNLVQTFDIDMNCLYRFLRYISSRYRNVPFHNWFHAFNVTQTMYFFLTSCSAGQILGPLEIMALLVSAICHDADHPGLNNSFQLKADTKVAYLHKKSTLENHHLLHGYYALSNPECNIVQNLDDTRKDLFMRYLKNLILATDLALHGIILRNLKERKKSIARMYLKQTGETESEDAITIMCCLMKCSDLSNEIRPRALATRWANMVMQEFVKQSAKETTLQLPITPFMDPARIIIAKEQINFILNLCMPLYKTLSSVLPEVNVCIKRMQSNLVEWNQRLHTFYSEEQVHAASNQSIWERAQVKDRKQKLSDALKRQASHK
uniref:PDEase domain-containing protein n=1 Tax=Arcella intermedia TaxID=1963864 RepID=A0A6B2L211_9EUKA